MLGGVLGGAEAAASTGWATALGGADGAGPSERSTTVHPATLARTVAARPAVSHGQRRSAHRDPPAPAGAAVTSEGFAATALSAPGATLSPAGTGMG
ncbi:hypothetical protein GCM10010201_01980 [Pilimelia columellifera subsp. columellifera]|uniref:Uncharacterized protein n=1 Tax=Pilimelia columellifera subsp. columellifera TaxID=706583 RepID=A0ABN3MYB2_9ACTN